MMGFNYTTLSVFFTIYVVIFTESTIFHNFFYPKNDDSTYFLEMFASATLFRNK